MEQIFGHIKGLEGVKLKLFERILLPFKYPELFQGQNRYRMERCILLFGPSKCGKTALLKTLSIFPTVELQLKDEETPQQFEKRLLEVKSAVKEDSHSLVIIDNIDLLESKGRQNFTEFHITIRHIIENSEAIVVATSNKPHLIDYQSRRNFQLRIQVSPLTQQEIEQFTDMEGLHGYNTEDILNIVERGKIEKEQKIDQQELNPINQFQINFGHEE